MYLAGAQSAGVTHVFANSFTAPLFVPPNVSCRIAKASLLPSLREGDVGRIMWKVLAC